MATTPPATERKVRFSSRGPDAVTLEGLLGTADVALPRPAAVLCHPGMQGQTGMEYPVIAACSAELHRAGFVTLRFNFRGVQGSKGQRSSGQREVDDVLGAIGRIRQLDEVDASQIYLVGNSFGAWMATEAAAQDPHVAGLACIVLPLALLPLPPDYLSWDRRPKLFIAAEHDAFCPLAQLQSLFDQWATPKKLSVLAGSDHFLGIGPSQDRVNRAREVAGTASTWPQRTCARKQ
jgi:alpha/beta superfamily hydrolase